MEGIYLDFSDDAVENALLFSVAGGVATEVTREGLVFTDQVQPRFEGTKVTKEIPLMVEGEYAVLNRATKRYQKAKITHESIESYLRNTPRDVAVNYEHRRGEGKTKGWVRIKDTARIGKMKTPQGEKTALFASLELYDEAAEDVRRGYFRDVSIELKPVASEIIGCALTATPVMRDLQFYSDVMEEEAPTEEEAEEATEPAPQPASTTEASEPVEEPTPEGEPTPDQHHSNQEEDPMEMTAEQKEALFAEQLERYGLKPEELAALPQLFAELETRERTARLSNARDKVRALVTNEDGKVKLAPAGIEAAAQLYAHLETQAELQFSVDGAEEPLSGTGILEELFSHIEAVQVFGESEGTPADQITPPTPKEGSEPSADGDRVAAISALMKARLGQ